MGKAKLFSLFDTILSVICVVFVVEAAAPAAAIGNAQFFWWIVLMLTFLLPYGLVVSELGTAYENDGGIYGWVRRAFGDKWGGRVAWFYWLNYPMWMASLAVLVPGIISAATGYLLPFSVTLLIQLVFIWSVVIISFSKVSDARWILNLSAVFKVLIALGIGGLGIYFVMNFGFSSDMSLESFVPSFDAGSLTYLSVILFNFMGFEIITTYASAMDNPKSQIPKSIIIGGIAVAGIYLFSSFGIGSAIPAAEVSLDSGILDAVAIMAGAGSFLVPIIAILFIVSLFGNVISWALGVNYVAEQASREHNMPRVFSITRKKNGVPAGAAVVNGIVATVLILILPLMEMLGFEEFFWIFFSMNITFLLLSYIPVFPAFLKLRKIDPYHVRVFRVPGNKLILCMLGAIPVLLLTLAIIATIVPLNTSDAELSKLPMLVGVGIFAIIGEVIRRKAAQGNNLRKKTRP